MRLAFVVVFFLSASLLFGVLQSNAFAQLDIGYKEPAYSLKQTYDNLLNEMDEGIKKTENTLSGLYFDNNEAKKKIDNAWSIRYTAWQQHDSIKTKLFGVNNNIQNNEYGIAYTKLKSIDSEFYANKEILYTALKTIKEARELEKNYQEKQRFCFLFWCSEIKNTYGVLDDKITDLELHLSNIEKMLSELQIQKSAIAQNLLQSELDVKEALLQLQQEERLREQQEAERQQELLEQQIRKEQHESAKQQQEYEEKIRQEEQRAYEEEQRAYEEQQKRLQEQREYEEKIRQEQEAAKREQEQLQQQVLREREFSEKQRITEQARTNPLIQGIINEQISFYIQPIPPYYQVSGINAAVDDIATSLSSETLYGVKFVRVYNSNLADLRINWIQNYGTHVLGESIFKSIIKVGMGMNNCDGEWQPFDTQTIKKIMWHEIGHSLGYSHSDVPNNVMYYQTTTQFAVDKEFSENIPNGGWYWFSFCGSGKQYYQVSSNSDEDGFDVYVLPPETDTNTFASTERGLVYTDCGAKRKVYYYETCFIASGSKLIIHNYERYMITITGKMIDMNTGHWPDMRWDQNAFQYDIDYLNYVWDLFHPN